MYKDVKGGERASHPFIVCQLESLHTLSADSEDHRHFDLVILDESESILYQFSAGTVKHFDLISVMFERYIRTACHCLWADAFLSDRTVDACIGIDPTVSRTLLWNTFVPLGRTAYQVGRGADAKKAIVAAALERPDERGVFVCASKGLAKDLASRLDSDATPTLTIHADTGDAVKRRLEDVNSLLIDYYHFVYTSALTVGESLAPRRPCVSGVLQGSLPDPAGPCTGRSRRNLA